MRRAPLFLPMLTLVLLILPVGASDLNRVVRLPPLSVWSKTVLCRAGETLEITISAMSSARMNTDNENDRIGFDCEIEQYNDAAILARANVRNFTWMHSAGQSMFLEIFISNSHQYYELVIQVSIKTAVIPNVTLTNIMILSPIIVLCALVIWTIRRSRWWTSRDVNRYGDDRSSSLEPTPLVTVPATYLLKSRISILWNEKRKRTTVRESDDVE